jgi:hypothetical protein
MTIATIEQVLQFLNDPSQVATPLDGFGFNFGPYVPPPSNFVGIPSASGSSLSLSTSPSMVVGQHLDMSVSSTSSNRRLPKHTAVPVGFIWDDVDGSKKAKFTLKDLHSAYPPAALWCISSISFFLGRWMDLLKNNQKFAVPLQDKAFQVYDTLNDSPMHKAIGDVMTHLKKNPATYNKFVGSGYSEWLGKHPRVTPPFTPPLLLASFFALNSPFPVPSNHHDCPHSLPFPETWCG